MMAENKQPYQNEFSQEFLEAFIKAKQRFEAIPDDELPPDFTNASGNSIGIYSDKGKINTEKLERYTH